MGLAATPPFLTKNMKRDLPNLPKKINVGSHIYTIRLIKSPKDENEYVEGIIIHDNEMIYIDRDLPLSGKWSTLFHEVLHAIEFVYDIKFKHKKIERLAPYLYQFLRANKLLWKQITKTKKR